jgi:hypothetical protein
VDRSFGNAEAAGRRVRCSEESYARPPADVSPLSGRASEAAVSRGSPLGQPRVQKLSRIARSELNLWPSETCWASALPERDRRRPISCNEASRRADLFLVICAQFSAGHSGLSSLCARLRHLWLPSSSSGDPRAHRCGSASRRLCERLPQAAVRQKPGNAPNAPPCCFGLADDRAATVHSA